MPSTYNTHPRAYGQGAFWHVCRKCGNNHGLIRKYHMMLCRRCFRENSVAIGFRKVRNLDAAEDEDAVSLVLSSQ